MSPTDLESLRAAAEAGRRVASSLATADENDQLVLRRAVAASNVRIRKYAILAHRFGDDRKVGVAKLLFAAPVMLPMVWIGPAITGEGTVEFQIWPLLFAAAFLISVSTGPAILSRYRSFNFRLSEIDGTERRNRTLTYVIGGAVGVLLIGGAVIIILRLLYPERFAGIVSFQLLALFGFLTLFYPWWMNFSSTLLLFPDRHRPRPLDGALVDLAKVAHYANEWKRLWYDPKRSLTLVSELEATARRIESIAWRSRRVSLMDRRGRAEYRGDLLALAFTVRKHKRVLMRANSASGFEVVHASLSAGCLALVDNDWDSLIESTNVSLTSRALLLWRRLFPGVIMVSASFLIPILPGVSDSPELALSARVTLLATAVLYLAMPVDSPITGRILETLGKSFK
ncbi:hypothetical protein [Streptomyces sp. PTD9-10]|uniref:hypothetical protein n=1 Tax=Streptomyces sp. PTD9-10 TaxID=3120151 RepID=UPI00300A62F4